MRRTPHPLTDAALLRMQAAVAAVTLAWIPIERAFPYWEAIRLVGSPWRVDLTQDPLYRWRALVMGLNGLGWLVVAALALMVTWRWIKQPQSGWRVVWSAALLWMSSARFFLFAPYWINGVGKSLTATPRFDMDPKALIPGVWLPMWSPMLIWLMLAVAFPFLEAGVLWLAYRTRQWRIALGLQLPFLIVWGLAQLAPSLGYWLAD